MILWQKDFVLCEPSHLKKLISVDYCEKESQNETAIFPNQRMTKHFRIPTVDVVSSILTFKKSVRQKEPESLWGAKKQNGKSYVE
jgi:hypothetical protein